jgi:hypothetical protein
MNVLPPQQVLLEAGLSVHPEAGAASVCKTPGLNATAETRLIGGQSRGNRDLSA